MQKKVLLAKDKNQNTVGLVCLESDLNLKITLKLFEEEKGTLVLKVGENLLAFENAKNNSSFQTIFHDLNLPITCILCDDKILIVANSENSTKNFDAVFEEYKKTRQQETLEHKEQEEKMNEQSVQYLKKQEDEILENAKNEVKKLEKSVKNDAKTENFSFKNQKSLAENIDETENFYDQISKQFEQLFSKSTPFLEMEEIVENSKWVKVMCQTNFSNHYILGKIFDGENLTHIVYGTPAESEDEILDETLKPFSQWLPFEIDGVKGSGYFLMYQDAKTGENVLVE